MAQTTGLMHGVLYLNFQNNGWSERYPLKSTDYPTARDVFKKLAKLRMAFVGTGVEMVWARVSFAANPRESSGIDGLPLLPHPTVGDQNPPEDPFTAIHYRFETAQGKSAVRLFRGIPDNVVANYKFNGVAPEPLAAGQPIGDPDNPGTSLAYLQRSFLSYVIANCLHTRFLGLLGEPPAPTWETGDYARAMFRNIRKRDTGRPFGITRGRAASHS